MAEEPTVKCALVAGGFAKLVQVLLAVAAIGTLLYKRHREHPPRPWKIWFFDTAKQAVAGSLQHGVNMIFGIIFGNRGGTAGECIWYIVNFTITTVCGLFILTYWMKVQPA